jgi:hypothetical protein
MLPQTTTTQPFPSDLQPGGVAYKTSSNTHGLVCGSLKSFRPSCVGDRALITEVVSGVAFSMGDSLEFSSKDVPLMLLYEGNEVRFET